MGIFNFMKKKKQKDKTTLAADIKSASAWVLTALNSSGYKIDMNIDSLKELDRFFEEHIDDATGTAKNGGLLSEGIGSKLFAIGALIGEIIINKYNGQWITDDSDEMNEINIAVKLENGSMIWPVQRVMKRCTEGPENDIYNYAVGVGRK